MPLGRLTTKVYLSGPMTGLLDSNRQAFDRAAEKARALGYEVVSPIEIDYQGDKSQWSWAGRLRVDIGKLVTCDLVATLPNWKMSRGANLEVSIAKALGMKTIPIERLDLAPRITETDPAGEEDEKQTAD